MSIVCPHHLLGRATSFRTSPPYTPFIGPATPSPSYGFPTIRNGRIGDAKHLTTPLSTLKRETSFVSERDISPLCLDDVNDDPGLTKVDSMRIAIEQICLLPREKDRIAHKSLAFRRGQKQTLHLNLTPNGYIVSDTTATPLATLPYTPLDQMILPNSNPPPAHRQASPIDHRKPLPNCAIPRVLSFGSPAKKGNLNHISWEDKDLTPPGTDWLLQPRKVVVPLRSPIRLVSDYGHQYSPKGMDEDEELYGDTVYSSPTPTRTSVASK